MTKEEIKEGIKQALQRGESFKQAKQSFINAGYNPEQVNKAASEAGSFHFPPKTNQFPKSRNQTAFSKQPNHKNHEQDKNMKLKKISPQNFQKLTPYQEEDIKNNPAKPDIQVKSEKSQKGIAILLIFLLLFLIIGLFSFILFKEQIVSFIKTYVSFP